MFVLSAEAAKPYSEAAGRPDKHGEPAEQTAVRSGKTMERLWMHIMVEYIKRNGIPEVERSPFVHSKNEF